MTRTLAGTFALLLAIGLSGCVVVAQDRYRPRLHHAPSVHQHWHLQPAPRHFRARPHHHGHFGYRHRPRSWHHR